MMEHAFTNELINETSPYLLQHAHNPVEWHAWGPTALAKAKETDKPILVSIGYAACHWCHVMEKESFENEAVAEYMNAHFINIKIDREERPDLDHIYMEAVQAIAGNGGWPLNVFLTTDAKPFYGGTYFPPQKAFNRSSWKEILVFINDTWQKRRQEIEEQAETLLRHINSSNKFLTKDQSLLKAPQPGNFTEEQCKQITENILKSADLQHGGFGNAPKFPQTFIIQYLLAYGHYLKDEKAFGHAEFSLKKMMEGGIYDQLAGGLSRYSTDAQWLAPHFEKMLYDNALLVSVLCDAYQATNHSFYKDWIEKTLSFFINEMQHPAGGFYAALDADSEGVEGKFYVWDKIEIDALLGEDSKIFCAWYGVTSAGNWEHKNILNVSQSKEAFTKQNSITISRLDQLLHSSEKKLLSKRNERVRPATDDKILLGWNALLLTAFCKAAAALENETYKQTAIKLFDFLVEKFSEEGMIVYHSYKNGIAKHPAYLDDYAYLVQSALLLQELTGGLHYLEQAKSLTEYVLANFHDEKTGFFFYTNQSQKDIIARKIEVYDGAVPSGNAIMAENLYYLSVLFDKNEWGLIANKMLNNLEEILIKYPSSFGIWAGFLLKLTLGIHEIVITGKDPHNLLNQVLKIFMPGKIVQSAVEENDLPLLRNKIYGEEAWINVCKNYTCSAPVADISDFKKVLGITHK